MAFEERAHAWEEATRTAGDEFRMRVRVATRGMMGLLSVPQLLLPWKYPWIAFQLLSHKISRWSIPLFLACLFVGSLFLASRPEFLMLLCIQLLFYGWALASLVIPATAPLTTAQPAALFLHHQHSFPVGHHQRRSRPSIQRLATRSRLSNAYHVSNSG